MSQHLGVTVSNNPHVEVDECATAVLIARFNAHVAAVESNTSNVRRRVYDILCAKGLHKLLAERALQDDEDAGNTALGAPHWVTFNAGTLENLMKTGDICV